MAENSKIEWTDHTFNPWIGCTKVSDGCKNCYAEALMDKRYGRAKWGPQGIRVRTSAANWKKPLKWNREAKKKGVQFRVFCASLADWAEVKKDQPELEKWRFDVLNLIRLTPNIDWLLLTKRTKDALTFFDALYQDPGHWWDLVDPEFAEWMDENDWSARKPIPNIWIGTSVENQEQADKRIPELLRIPASVRFLSMEPLLGPVDLTKLPSCYEGHNRPLLRLDSLRGGHWCGDGGYFGPDDELDNPPTIDWVIVGGESGPNARPMNPEWAQGIRDQCQEVGVPFFFKQWGEYKPLEYPDVIDGSPHIIKFDNGQPHGFSRVGKKAAGRLLGGREWNESP